jgi:tetratricopeptide (TPR) repeat protein
MSVLAVVFLSLSTSVSLAENKADEFRGHKWGSSLESFGEMEQLHAETVGEGVEEEVVVSIYTKPGEELTMGGVEVESIVYFFGNYQFIMAQVVFNTEGNFNRLIEVLESRYGKGVKKNYPDFSGDKLYEGLTGKKSPERNRYWWVLRQQNLSLYIEYIEKDEKGQIIYFYEPDNQDEGQDVEDYYVYGQQGSDYIKQGKYDEAIESLTKAIELNHKGDMAYNTRGWAYYKKSQYDLAISDYTKSLEINPEIELYYNNRGLAYLDSGQNDFAVSDFTRAIEINPDGDRIYYFRGMAHFNNGNYDLAISDYTKAIELFKEDGNHYFMRGRALLRKGLYDLALADFDETVKLYPGHADAYNEQAWILATCPDEQYRDGVKAVELAENAVALSPTPRVLDTLAAAYAEAGMFDDAVATQEEAISILKKEDKPQEVIEDYKTRLVSYQAHKPWRE